jgi:hypothetical protein
MAGIRVSVEREGISNLGEKSKQAQRKRMMRAATIGYNWSVERAPEDRGQLKQTSVEPTWDGNIIRWGYTQPYAEDQEFGTEPFRPTGQEVEDILEWSRRTVGDDSLGWVLIKHVFPRRGIRAKGFTQEGAERQKQAYDGTSFEDMFE